MVELARRIVCGNKRGLVVHPFVNEEGLCTSNVEAIAPDVDGKHEHEMVDPPGYFLVIPLKPRVGIQGNISQVAKNPDSKPAIRELP